MGAGAKVNIGLPIRRPLSILFPNPRPDHREIRAGVAERDGGLPVEPVSAAVTAALVMKYLLPAISDLGERVLGEVEESVSSSAVAFGKKLLQSMLRHRRAIPEQGGVAALEAVVERRVLGVANNPNESKPSVQLEAAIEDLLLEDSELRRSIQEMLQGAPKDQRSQSRRSVHVGRDSFGPIVAGDGNTVTQAWPS